ncbi:hypothetical protein FEM48_Zijuj04G0181000 [Ziziphus jujuba var. spinosa]|uniref:DNA cross-link repair protein SNM1 n=1 Tax=Ziziphus jujuba var. spinosa TaxID=714518 RepID=A0A978VLD5_ZIZJJ|nr:hypothetical protein FEM48_Zijuj04G0181000 [Ziziphus jujuba var. spinosa]
MAFSKTLTFDSSNLFLTAQTSFFRQPPPPLSFAPFPTAFPQSKLIPKTRFAVDSFRYAGDHSVSYFLSHFHSDHYTGLSPNWSKGVVFCSQTTAKLLIKVLKVPSQFIVPLPLSEPVVIDGCEVVLIDANHCPGSVQFLFEILGSNGKFKKRFKGEKGYTKAVGFVPTGWTYEVKRNKFSARFLKPKRVVPTVGLDVEKLDSKHVDKTKKHFAGLVDEMANKQEFLKGFHRGCDGVGEMVEKDSGSATSQGLCYYLHYPFLLSLVSLGDSLAQSGGSSSRTGPICHGVETGLTCG